MKFENGAGGAKSFIANRLYSSFDIVCDVLVNLLV